MAIYKELTKLWCEFCTRHQKNKSKALAYKLLSDIEAATDLKVLEKCILNGKVEFALGEVIGIAKREFHEVIIDIITRKIQIIDESMTSNT